MNSLCYAVFEVLQKYTAFPWPVLSTQCKRAGVDTATLSTPDLLKIIPGLAAGVARFTSPQNEALVLRELQRLAG